MTLKALGKIEKSIGGFDFILNREKIVGDAGQANAIDGTVSGGGPVSFDIDLGAKSLKLIGVPEGTVAFTVENFVNVTGTSNNDEITGSWVSNLLRGGDGADTVHGARGADTLEGGAGTTSLSAG